MLPEHACLAQHVEVVGERRVRDRRVERAAALLATRPRQLGHHHAPDRVRQRVQDLLQRDLGQLGVLNGPRGGAGACHKRLLETAATRSMVRPAPEFVVLSIASVLTKNNSLLHLLPADHLLSRSSCGGREHLLAVEQDAARQDLVSRRSGADLGLLAGVDHDHDLPRGRDVRRGLVRGVPLVPVGILQVADLHRRAAGLGGHLVGDRPGLAADLGPADLLDRDHEPAYHQDQRADHCERLHAVQRYSRSSTPASFAGWTRRHPRELCRNGPPLVGPAGAGPDLQSGAVGRAVVPHVQALAAADVHQRAVGRRPTLVAAAEAVPQLGVVVGDGEPRQARVGRAVVVGVEAAGEVGGADRLAQEAHADAAHRVEQRAHGLGFDRGCQARQHGGRRVGDRRAEAVDRLVLAVRVDHDRRVRRLRTALTACGTSNPPRRPGSVRPPRSSIRNLGRPPSCASTTRSPSARCRPRANAACGCPRTCPWSGSTTST